MNEDVFFKLPRLFVDAPLVVDGEITLTVEQAHYFKTVLRRQEGDRIRVFNGKDGEFLASLSVLGKKSGQAVLQRQLKPQPTRTMPVHLFFAPIRKTRMDWLVEKAVELGATDLHPVITQNTETRTINTGRLAQHIFEAAEQCERLDLPVLHDIVKLYDMADHVPDQMAMMACLERGEPRPVDQVLRSLVKDGSVKDEPEDGPPDHSLGVLIGPEGGFTAAEAAWIGGQKNWHTVSLGPRILRCETAVCVALTAIMLHHG